MEEKPTTTQQAIMNTFDRAAKNFGQRGPKHFEHFGRRLVELAGVVSGSKVLDVATGRGAVLFPTADRVGPTGRVTAIDLAEGMIRETSADIEHRQLGNVDVHRMDAQSLDFSSDSFDWVLAGFALFFFPRPAQALREFHRVLRPGGRLGLTTWEQYSEIPFRFLAYIEKYLPDDVRRAERARNRFETAPVLEAALTEARFASVSVNVEEATLFFPDEETLWLTVAGGGMGRLLEIAGPAASEKIRDEIIEAVRPTREDCGVPVWFRALVAFGTKGT